MAPLPFTSCVRACNRSLEPVPLSGVSQAAVLANTSAYVKSFALSQYPRCPVDAQVLWKRNWCINVNSSDFGWMGYSLRTRGPGNGGGGWRYTAWLPWNGTSAVFPEQRRNGTGGFFEELYAYPLGAQEDNFDLLDTHEVSRDHPEEAAALYVQLTRLVTSGHSHAPVTP